MLKKFNLLLVLFSSLLFSGCAAVALTAGGIAAGTGVNHTLSGIVYKTVIAPVQNSRLAALKTLNRMEAKVTADEKTETGWSITASAINREIIVELEELTPTTTRMRVTVNKDGGILKDSATATEIIAQSVEQLNRDQNDKA